MIRVRHEPLPAGLSAVVRRRPGGDTDVVVSTVLSPARQRAAVRVGLRAARPTDRRAVLPVPLLGALAVGWPWLRAIARALRTHTAAMVAAAGVVTTAAVVIAVVPQLTAPGGGHPGAGGPAPAPVPAQTAGRPATSTPPAVVTRPTAQPSSSVVPVAARSPASSGGGAVPSAAPSGPSSGAQPSAPAAPGPSPSPSAGGGGLCLDLLGIWVCL